MLHGWTGDENSMWIFASRLPKNALLIAPRAMHPSAQGGYSWHPAINRPWPSMDDFASAVETLVEEISPRRFPEADFSEFNLLGFSQGAALAYTLAIRYPERIKTVAGLSGFLPDGTSSWLRPGILSGMPVFIAHGTLDELVPVAMARQSVDLLKQAGAAVTYCEDEVGHKLSAKCFRGLEAFVQRTNC